LSRRDVLSHEHGTVFKKWTQKVPVCIVYPNSYYIGMSNLAVHLMYRELNSRPEVVCERLFVEDDGKDLSVESSRDVSSFELVFLTLPFEMDYPAIPKLLRDASIPLYARNRVGSNPIFVAGGISLMANPEPIADFIDLFIMGDVEACLPAFIDRYLEVRGKTREEILEELSKWPWAYNPRHMDVEYNGDGTVNSFSPKDFSVHIEHYRGRDLATSAIISSETEFSDMLLAEGTRGCPSRCAFCLAGNIYPFISDRLERIGGDVKDIGIIGGGISYHPHLADIIRNFKKMGIQPHLPSLRLDEVPLEVIDLLKDSIKTLTFGIEAGTEALRRCIGKNLTDRDIAERIEAMAHIKSFHFKFYFMLGLPGETRNDVEAIVELIKHILHLLVKKGSSKGRIGSITIHASPFVPKAATPFQWLAMEEMKELKERIAILKRGLGKVPNTHFTHESVKYSFLQGVFARGDRRLGDIILRLADGAGIAQIMRESPINLNFYVNRERKADEIFPWDFIKGKTTKEKLYTRLQTCLSYQSKILTEPDGLK
jgi:radical SAM superfamily enzyme YgiQ (UPF0313 family)